MIGFTKKQPADYQHPYKDMIKEITVQVDYLQKEKRRIVTYIIIHPEDFDDLLLEMEKSKMLPPGKVPVKPQLSGIRIVRSTDMDKGSFDVVGN